MFFLLLTDSHALTMHKPDTKITLEVTAVLGISTFRPYVTRNVTVTMFRPMMGDKKCNYSLVCHTVFLFIYFIFSLFINSTQIIFTYYKALCNTVRCTVNLIKAGKIRIEGNEIRCTYLYLHIYIFVINNKVSA